MQITQEQIDDLQYQANVAELNCRFGWNTDLAGNSYNADGISATFDYVLESLGLEKLPITEDVVFEHLQNCSEDPNDYELSDYTD